MTQIRVVSGVQTCIYHNKRATLVACGMAGMWNPLRWLVLRGQSCGTVIGRCLAGLAVLAVTFYLSVATAEAQTEKRVALVIGNSAYQHSATLENPKNDSQDLADTLGKLGFQVILEENLDKRGMEQAFSHFARLAQDAEVAMFYYAGHAMQYGGENFLVPVDAALQDEFSVEFEMARVSDVMNSLERARGVKILVLDACRNNPLAEQLARRATNRDYFASRGLARIEHPSGMLIAYATQAGQVADDGRGRNSPFTSALIKRIEEPGVEIGQIFRRVAVDVNTLTQGRQLPDLSMSLLGEVYLSKPAKPAVNGEVEAWQKIASSNDRSQFERFVSDFPDSPFSIVAKERIRIIEDKRRQDEAEKAARDQAARDQAAREQAARDQAARERIAKQQADLQAQEQISQELAAKQQAAREHALKDETARQQQVAAAEAAKAQALEQAAREQAAQQAAIAQAAWQKAQTDKAVQQQAAVQPKAELMSAASDPPAALSQSIAHELRRVGCFRGTDSDPWSTGPKAGLQQYLKLTKLNVSAEQPSAQILDILKVQSGQICSLPCKTGETLVDGACTAKTCQAGMTVAANGKCVAAHARESAKQKRPDKLVSRSLSPEPQTRPAPRVRQHAHRVYQEDPQPEMVESAPPPVRVAPAPPPMMGMPRLCLGVGPLAVCR
jgi:flagellar biosynthesis GTPase FlhF